MFKSPQWLRSCDTPAASCHYSSGLRRDPSALRLQAEAEPDGKLSRLNHSVEQGSRTLAWIGLILSSALVLIADYPWGDFRGHSHWTRVVWVPFVTRPIRVSDIVLNVLLCAPLGGFAGRLFRHPLLSAFGLSLLLSLAGEWMQVYSHTRFPSMTDVTCNVAGAVLAAAFSRRLGRSRKLCR